MKTKTEEKTGRPAPRISEFRNSRQEADPQGRRDSGFDSKVRTFDVVFEFAPDPAQTLDSQARAVRVALDRGRL